MQKLLSLKKLFFYPKTCFTVKMEDLMSKSKDAF